MPIFLGKKKESYISAKSIAFFLVETLKLQVILSTVAMNEMQFLQNSINIAFFKDKNLLATERGDVIWSPAFRWLYMTVFPYRKEYI